MKRAIPDETTKLSNSAKCPGEVHIYGIVQTCMDDNGCLPPGRSRIAALQIIIEGGTYYGIFRGNQESLFMQEI